MRGDPRVERCHHLVREQPQLPGLRRPSGGPGRVAHGAGPGPPAVGAEQPVEGLRRAGERLGGDAAASSAASPWTGSPGGYRTYTPLHARALRALGLRRR
ncbi:hypothetical protein GCM10009801_68070 [Streptomyces albiaxialis]|uniref:Uncharacterized protein n=1 Tax=Streptomyces albiaxialis TaxID=329523 RepID=A0ABP5IBJ2_9ACTN